MSDVNITQDGHVGIAEINRPPDNFFDMVLIAALAEAFDGFAARNMRAILLCATGKNFCAGADFRRAGGGDPKTEAAALYREALRLYSCPLPVVVAVQGSAIGGGLGLAMVGDLRVASPESRFSANFARLGLHAGFGLTATLPRAIGEQRAALLLYTGRRIDGREAAAIGLVDRVVDQDALRAEALALASEIAQSSPIAVQSMRATLRHGLADRIAAATERELSEQARHFASEDFREGVQAMAERRPPQFTGGSTRAEGGIR